MVSQRFGLETEDKEPAAILEDVARLRSCLMKGGELDIARAAAMVLDDFRSGKLGRVTLERPEDYKDKE